MRYILFLASLWLFAQCGTEQKRNTPSAGYIRIAVDESFRPLIDTATDVFEGLYRKAKIGIMYRSEENAIAEMLKDSVKMVVVSRKLRSDEEAELKRQDARITSIKIATDAVALITHRESPDSTLTIKDFEEIVRGKRKSKTGEPIVLVFDNNYSSNLNYIRDYFKLSEKDSIKIYAAKSNQDVIDYASNNHNAIGVIGVNWISDVDNSKNQRFLDKIRVIALSDKEKPESREDYVEPYQAYLDQYPLKRDVYAISREIGSGLAAGFITFLSREKGQLIILKEGLLPATMPTRSVTVK
jgi:phosphate transport system substrate-binding protein